MTLIAKPYRWDEGDPTRHTRLLDYFVEHPQWTTTPLSPEVARVHGAQLVTDPANVVYECWKDQTSIGILILSRVAPRVDAVLHFMFLDGDLVGKRRLLINFLGTCFHELGFRRLSLWTPDHSKLEKFARRVLGFRYEGEGRPRNPELSAALDMTWVAKQGSRREQSLFDGAEWRDMVVMRLLASEWDARFGNGGQHAD